MEDIDGQIEIFEKRLLEQREHVALTVKQIKRLKQAKLETMDVTTWEKFRAWLEMGLGSTNYQWIIHFGLVLDVPDGYPPHVDLIRDLYYRPSWKAGGVCSRIDFFDRHRTMKINEIFEILSCLYDEIDTDEYPFWKVRKKYGSEWKGLPDKIEIPLTHEHLETIAQDIMTRDIKSYVNDW